MPRQLSKKLKTFFQFFTAFLKSRFKFKHCEKKDERRRLCICEVIGHKKRGYVNVERVTFQCALGQSTC